MPFIRTVVLSFCLGLGLLAQAAEQPKQVQLTLFDIQVEAKKPHPSWFSRLPRLPSANACFHAIALAGVLGGTYLWGVGHERERQQAHWSQERRAFERATYLDKYTESRDKVEKAQEALRGLSAESPTNALTMRASLVAEQAVSLIKLLSLLPQPIDTHRPLAELFMEAGLSPEAASELGEKGVFDGMAYWELKPSISKNGTELKIELEEPAEFRKLHSSPKGTLRPEELRPRDRSFTI